MFLHNLIAVASENIFDTQMSPTTSQPIPVPLTINTRSNKSLDNEIESAESADYSNISQWKYIFSLFVSKFTIT